MTHIRQQIRNAIAAAVTGLATTGSSVYTSRVHPLETTDLPALRIYTIRDQAERLTQGNPVRVQRAIQVIIEAVVAVTDALEDELDAIGVEVEIVLADNRLGGLVKDLFLVEATKALTGEGERQAGLLRMEFLADAHIAENDPESALP